MRKWGLSGIAEKWLELIHLTEISALSDEKSTLSVERSFDICGIFYNLSYYKFNYL